jgi:hypothetical protein
MIDTFDGTDRFLSNFFPSEISVSGKKFPTVEHAYQAAKTTDAGEQERIRKAKSAGEAKKLGRKATMRMDWESSKLQVMESLLRLKFEDPDLKRRLLETGNEELVEGNHWHDNFWGVCNCSKCKKAGKNNLGRLLMRIREEIADGQKEG